MEMDVLTLVLFEGSDFPFNGSYVYTRELPTLLQLLEGAWGCVGEQLS